MRAKETLICIVAVALLIYSLTVFAGAGRELDRLKAEAGAAADRLGELEKENSSLQTSLEEGVSDEELERLARERLALVLPGEKIFYFVTDSNTFLAVCIGVSSFLLFKNLKIKQSRVINTIAASTFGVLLIHANSDTMRKWLWQTVLNVKGAFSLSTPLLVLHATLSVLGVFTVCVIIDQIRIRTVERFVLDKAEKGVHKLLSR